MADNENVLHNYANQYLYSQSEAESTDADVMRLRDEIKNDMKDMMYNHVSSNEGIDMEGFVDNIISHENTVFGREVINKETDGPWIQQMVTDICTDEGIQSDWFGK